MANKLKFPLRIATLNVRGLSARRKQYQLSRLLLENDLDLIAVQETKIETEEQTDRMVETFRARFNICVSHAVGTSGGCLILYRNSIDIVEEAVIACQSGRFVVLDFGFCGMLWRALCVYAPNTPQERRDFFGTIESYVKCDRNVILFGDFNCVQRPEDRSKKLLARDKSAMYLTEVVNEHDLEDVGSVLVSGNGTAYTHFQGDCHARLDRIYVPALFLPECVDYHVKCVSFSDHCLVTVTVGTKEKASKFNWFTWKFNDKLLQDQPFLEKLKEKIHNLLCDESGSISASWEIFKSEIKLAAIDRACVLHRKEKEKEKELYTTLEFMIATENYKPGLFAKQIKEIKSKLEAVDIERYRGAVVRARAERFWCGETPTKRALGDEKRHAVKKEINEICYHNRVTTDSNIIEMAFVERFRNLLNHKKENTELFKNNFLPLMPKLEKELCEELERPITVKEVEKAIDELSLGKSPGPDGLGAAFYKCFKAEMAEVLHHVINECYEMKRMPPSFRMTHMVLIPKTNDPLKLRSVEAYRPISLTNVDYKVHMKVLAKRLQKVIKILIGPHQTCGIQGRTIYTNIHVARSILESCDAEEGRVAMLQLDLEKAFDKVTHEILLLILEHTNVGSVILDGVRMAYEGCTTKLVINKQLSESITVTSSLRQGCPVSSLLFALYVEPFCLKILQNPTIQGFRYCNNEVKVLAYADDIAVFCSDIKSVEIVVKETTAFCEATGSAVNWTKSLGIWYGNWPITPEVYCNMQWSNSPNVYLGVPLQHHNSTTGYWLEEADRVRDQTQKWGGHKFSVFTRANVCNTFLVAKIFYVLQVLSMTRMTIQKLHRVFAVFIWGSSWERTSRCNLFHAVRNGGLGLSHLFLKQVVSRFIFLRDQSDTFLRTVIQVRLWNHLADYVVSTSAATHGALPCFLREVVAAYRIVRAHFSLEYLCVVGKKKLYKDLVDVFLPTPLYRANYYLGDERNVLKRVKRMPVRSSAKTFFFQLHTETLPVKPWLQSKGIFVPWTINCRICQKPETIEHIFLDCHDARFLWDILQRTIKKDLVLSPFGIRFLPYDETGGVPSDMVMLLCMHALWKTRMADRYADIDARPARQYFMESVIYTRDVLNFAVNAPQWVTQLDEFASLKPF